MVSIIYRQRCEKPKLDEVNEKHPFYYPILQIREVKKESMTSKITKRMPEKHLHKVYAEKNRSRREEARVEKKYHDIV